MVEHFRGQVNVAQILDASGDDVSANYLLDCTYMMKRLQGRPVKYEQLPDEEQDWLSKDICEP